MIGPFTSAGRSRRLPKLGILGSRDWKRSFSGLVTGKLDFTSDNLLVVEGDLVVSSDADEAGDVFKLGKIDHTEYSSNFENEMA